MLRYPKTSIGNYNALGLVRVSQFSLMTSWSSDSCTGGSSSTASTGAVIVVFLRLGWLTAWRYPLVSIKLFLRVNCQSYICALIILTVGQKNDDKNRKRLHDLSDDSLAERRWRSVHRNVNTGVYLCLHTDKIKRAVINTAIIIMCVRERSPSCAGLKLNFFNHLPWGPVSLKFYWPAKYSTVPLFSCKLLVFFKAFINKLVK